MGVLDYLKPGRLNANAVYYLGGISQFFPGLQVPAKQDRLNRCWTPIVMLYARPIDLLDSSRSIKEKVYSNLAGRAVQRVDCRLY